MDLDCQLPDVLDVPIRRSPELTLAGLPPVSLRGGCREPMVGKGDDAHHCPIRRGCKRTIKPPTRRSPAGEPGFRSLGAWLRGRG
jgi:hypothetical protein